MEYIEKINGYIIVFQIEQKALRSIAIQKDLGCTSEIIDELKIPESVKKIKSNLTIRFLPENNSSYINHLVLPDTVVSVENFAFENIKNIKEVTWSKSCKIIPQGCFYNSSLEQIHGIEEVSCIESRAFAISNLKTIYYPKSCKSISYNCFYSSKLESINGIDKIVEIVKGAFAETQITSFIIPSGVKAIPDQCFRNCKKLKSISPLINISSIGEFAFSGCNKLEEITIISSQITVSITAFNHMARNCKIDLSKSFVDFSSDLYPKNKFILQDWIKNSKNRGVILPYYLYEGVDSNE